MTPYDMYPEYNEMKGRLYAMIFDSAYNKLVETLMSVRDELSRHEVAVGPCFIAGWIPGVLDREKRIESAKRTERTLVAILSQLAAIRMELRDSRDNGKTEIDNLIGILKDAT